MAHLLPKERRQIHEDSYLTTLFPAYVVDKQTGRNWNEMQEMCDRAIFSPKKKGRKSALPSIGEEDSQATQEFEPQAAPQTPLRTPQRQSRAVSPARLESRLAEESAAQPQEPKGQPEVIIGSPAMYRTNTRAHTQTHTLTLTFTLTLTLTRSCRGTRSRTPVRPFSERDS